MPLEEITDGHGTGPVPPDEAVVVDQSLLSGWILLFHQGVELPDEVDQTAGLSGRVIDGVVIEKRILAGTVHTGSLSRNGGPDQVPVLSVYHPSLQRLGTCAKVPAKCPFFLIKKGLFPLLRTVEKADVDELIVREIERPESYSEMITL